MVKELVETCPEKLSAQHKEQYAELGYVAFEGVLNAGEVEQARQALSRVTHGMMQALRTGAAEVKQAQQGATKNYAGPRVVKSDADCAIHFEEGIDPLALDDREAELAFRKLHNYHTEDAVFEKLVAHRRICGFLSELVGQEMRLKDVMALSKPPLIGSEKPWHQDNAYFNWLPLDLVGTVWVALDDATVENGCMHLLPGEHRRGPLRHYHTIDCEILPDRIEAKQAVPIELKAGGALYFSALLPHQTPPNKSANRRRALQFQYRGVEAYQVSVEEFGRVFAERDGKPASCALAHEDG
ncbi:MAG: phytanoyl-CoA hydroxylase [Candidatus Latescibacterota bacterium]|jgi:phytanoyl-CoA hydroxylase